MSFTEIQSYIKSKNTGCSFDDLKKKFTDIDEDSIHKIVKNAIDLNLLKKDGSGRNTRYYDIKQTIVQGNSYNTETFKITSHGIDAIKEIVNSKIPLPSIKEILYEEQIKLNESKNKLSAFVAAGEIQHTVRLHFNPMKRINEVYMHQKKIKMNKMEITHNQEIDKFVISLYSCKNYSYPEEIYFNNFDELNNYIKKNW